MEQWGVGVLERWSVGVLELEAWVTARGCMKHGSLRLALLNSVPPEN